MSSLWHISLVAVATKVPAVLDALAPLKVLNLVIRPVEEAPPQVQKAAKTPKAAKFKGRRPRRSGTLVLAALENGPLSVREIKTALHEGGGYPNNSSTLLKSLLKRRLIKKLPTGQYERRQS